MKIKVLYREITCCPECPFCIGDFTKDFEEQTCNNLDRELSEIFLSSIPPDCPLPDFRTDTEDDSTE